jgi:hypothetical protein
MFDGESALAIYFFVHEIVPLILRNPMIRITLSVTRQLSYVMSPSLQLYRQLWRLSRCRSFSNISAISMSDDSAAYRRHNCQ